MDWKVWLRWGGAALASLLGLGFLIYDTYTGHFWVGLSYALGCAVIVITLAWGLEARSWLILVGIAEGINGLAGLAMLADFAQHQLPLQGTRVALAVRMQELTGQGAAPRKVNQDVALAGSMNCFAAGETMLSYGASEVFRAFMFVPEWRVLVRATDNREPPPPDLCKQSYRQLRAQDSGAFKALEETYEALKDGGAYRT